MLEPEAAASADAGTDMEQRIDGLFAELNADALRFQELYYGERRYLNELDQRRRAGYEELVPLPPPAVEPVAPPAA